MACATNKACVADIRGTGYNRNNFGYLCRKSRWSSHSPPVTPVLLQPAPGRFQHFSLKPPGTWGSFVFEPRVLRLVMLQPRAGGYEETGRQTRRVGEIVTGPLKGSSKASLWLNAGYQQVQRDKAVRLPMGKVCQETCQTREAKRPTGQVPSTWDSWIGVPCTARSLPLKPAPPSVGKTHNNVNCNEQKAAILRIPRLRTLEVAQE